VFLFPQVSPPKPCVHFPCLPYVPYVLSTSFCLILSPNLVGTHHKAPRGVSHQHIIKLHAVCHTNTSQSSTRCVTPTHCLTAWEHQISHKDDYDSGDGDAVSVQSCMLTSTRFLLLLISHTRIRSKVRRSIYSPACQVTRSIACLLP